MPPLPHGWALLVDPATGQTYYHHAATGVSQWERPEDLAAPQGEAAGLPAGWACHIDPDSGCPYYRCAATGASQWDPPPCQATAADAPPTRRLPPGWEEVWSEDA